MGARLLPGIPLSLRSAANCRRRGAAPHHQIGGRDFEVERDVVFVAAQQQRVAGFRET